MGVLDVMMLSNQATTTLFGRITLKMKVFGKTRQEPQLKGKKEDMRGMNAVKDCLTSCKLNLLTVEADNHYSALNEKRDSGFQSLFPS
jgi:hypothetical protein